MIEAMRRPVSLNISSFLILAATALAQQIPDRAFQPAIGTPAFPPGKGPVVAIDEAHCNFHTASGRYEPFARLLARDGYSVRASTSKFQAGTLQGVKVLVIANAVHPSNDQKWELPSPSAFAGEEIQALTAWIRDGGSLLLIADHMPFAGAASSLGNALGIEFTNGYVKDDKPGVDVLTKASGELLPDPLTAGIDAIAAFTGSAFRIAVDHRPLIRLGPGWQSILARRAGELGAEVPRISVEGWLQGAVLHVGKGRVAVFGEGAMFSAQLYGKDRLPMGMNHPEARQNPQFLRNVMRWLASSESRSE